MTGWISDDVGAITINYCYVTFVIENDRLHKAIDLEDMNSIQQSDIMLKPFKSIQT